MSKYNKIFVIGLNKTGTMTIHHLFKSNGFKALHWCISSDPKYKRNSVEESVIYNLKNNNNLLDKELDEKF